jgi:hypothetical protein
MLDVLEFKIISINVIIIFNQYSFNFSTASKIDSHLYSTNCILTRVEMYTFISFIKKLKLIIFNLFLNI